uniref:Transmembrane protein 59 like n=1 Tax=Varanus komodoensis TaxID=61221 RepID=A0A8D2L9P3_VARKO
MTPLRLLFSRLNLPSSFLLSTQRSVSKPWIIFVALLWILSNFPASRHPLAHQVHNAELGRRKSGVGGQRSHGAHRVLNACYRGCRLFSICHFVDATAELNATRAQCESACMEAYTGREGQFGCITGCRKQLPDMKKPALFSVFDLVSSFCNDIVSSAQSFISSTWTFYLQADDGKVVVFQVIEGDMIAENLNCSAFLSSKPIYRNVKVQLPAEPQGSPEHDFLGCMSKRSGLPRWILAACLFLSVMVMLWLSCASLVTAPDQHVKTQVWGGTSPAAFAWQLCPTDSLLGFLKYLILSLSSRKEEL